ncbi:MAG: hypothetical protein IJE53_01225 [Bacilli bacterium]|nr:hypothetical protein [Bacilli bacterium]
MMKNNKDNRKHLLIIILIILVLGIGYATLKTNLNILGTTTIKNNNFTIKFANIQEKEGSTTPTKAATIGSDETSLTFDIALDSPGDYYGFNVDIVNSGTLNAELESFEMTELTEEEQKYLTYDVKYSSGSAVSVGDIIPKKTTKTIEVLIAYKENPESYPTSSEQTHSFKFEVNFVETDKESKYEGTVVSILGDSISTLKGYIPTGNRARYVQTEAEAINGLLYMPYEETWWGQVINENNMVLGINDSWAGSRVSNTSATNSGDYGPDAAMAGMTRLQKLDDNGTPGLILFYGGTNDIGGAVAMGTFDPTASYATTLDTTATTYTNFVEAYTMAILRMQYLYPNAEIVVLLPTYTSSYYTLTELTTYNAEIIKICEHFDIKYIDLRESGITTSQLADGIHPNATGMDLISNYVTEKLNSNKSNENSSSSSGNNSSSITRTTANTYAQSLPANFSSTTNLYAELTPKTGYYTATGYDNTTATGLKAVSIVIPVVPGDKIQSSSFNDATPPTGGQAGIRVTYLKDNTIVSSFSPTEVNTEYKTNNYLTVPEGANAVSIAWWEADDTNWAYLLVN